MKRFVLITAILIVALSLLTGCNNNTDNVQSPHVHDFVDGLCWCGEHNDEQLNTDNNDVDNDNPVNVPTHAHSFIDGVCSCGEKDPNWIVPETPPANINKDKIEFKGFEYISNDFLGDHYYIRFRNEITELKVYEMIDCSDDVTWTLCKDLECTQSVPSKTVSLKEGDNIYYVLKEYKNNVEIFKINLYRNKMITVKFEKSSSINVEENSIIVPPTTANKYGYTLLAWDYDFAIPAPSTSFSINGVWEANTYTVSFKSEFGTGFMPSITARTNEEVNIPEILFEYPGYHIVGWKYKNKHCEFEGVSMDGHFTVIQEVELACVDGFRMVSHDVDLTAIWEENINTIHFVDKFNTIETKKKTVSAATGEKIDIPWTKSVDGYLFQGWALEENGDIQYSWSSDYVVGTDSEQYLYAIWKPITYSITYNCRVGSRTGKDITKLIVNNPNPTTFTIESDTIVLQPIEIEGYVFKGWSDSKGNIYQENVIERGSFNNRELCAIFENANHYLIEMINSSTFVANFSGERKTYRLIGVDDNGSVDLVKQYLQSLTQIVIAHDVMKNKKGETIEQIYLWDKDDSNIDNMVNLKLVRDGICKTTYLDTSYSEHPNIKYSSEFVEVAKNLNYTIVKYSNGDMCFYPKGCDTDDWDTANDNITSTNKSYAKIYYSAATKTGTFYYVVGMFMKSASWPAGEFILSDTVNSYNLSIKNGRFKYHMNKYSSVTGWCQFDTEGISNLIPTLTQIYSSDAATIEFKDIQKVSISQADKDAVLDIIKLYYSYFSNENSY